MAQSAMNYKTAKTILDSIVARLVEQKAGAAIAVVDDHGELVIFAKTDGCPLPSIQNAINKAFTAARERVDSAEVGRRSIDQGFPMTNFGDPRYTGWGGGVPIAVGGVVTGAVGVSGLTESEDIELALFGVSQVGGAT